MMAGLHRWLQHAARKRHAATRAAWLMALLATALALAAPRLVLQRRVFDGIVVLDITQSMNTLDTTLEGGPASRLAFAKARLRRALSQLPCGSRVGWGVFTEYRSYVLLMPVEVCANYPDLVATLGRIDGTMAWSGGSRITKGLFSALRISAHMAEQPAIVFVTDGHEAPPLPHDFVGALPDDATDPRGMIVGVGGDELRPIPKYDPAGHLLGLWGPQDVMQAPMRLPGDEQPARPQDAPTGTEHLSSLKQAHLIELAALTRLGYARLDASTPMREILQDDHATRRLAVTTELRGPLQAFALVCLIAAIGPKRRVPGVALARAWRGAFARRSRRPSARTGSDARAAVSRT